MFLSGSLKGEKASFWGFLGSASLATNVKYLGLLEQCELEHEDGIGSQ